MTDIESSVNSGDGVDQRRAAAPRPGGWRSRLKAPWWAVGLLAVGLVASGRLVPSASAQPASGPAGGKVCDNRILRGDYGFSFSGEYVGGGGRYVGVGSESCDDTGHCHGVTTINIDGVTSTAPFTSVYTINPDCTGVEVAEYYELGLVIHEAVTIVDGGREVHFMGTDPGATDLGVMKRR